MTAEVTAPMNGSESSENPQSPSSIAESDAERKKTDKDDWQTMLITVKETYEAQSAPSSRHKNLFSGRMGFKLRGWNFWPTDVYILGFASRFNFLLHPLHKWWLLVSLPCLLRILSCCLNSLRILMILPLYSQRLWNGYHERNGITMQTENERVGTVLR